MARLQLVGDDRGDRRELDRLGAEHEHVVRMEVGGRRGAGGTIRS